MKRNDYLWIACFYASILGLGFARPLVQRFWVEHQSQMEEGLKQIMAADAPAVPAPRVVTQKPEPGILVKSKWGRAMLHRGSGPKRLAHAGPLLVHTKTPTGASPANNTKKTDSLGNNPVS